jgi:hypothetical protein
MKVKLGMLLFSVFFAANVYAAEGMWTLDNLPKEHLRSTYGFEPDQAWIDRAQRSAVRIAQGCSASFISPDGLVLTNHHCARGCIDQLSTKEKNYVADGFLAKSREQEMKCPVLEVNRLESIIDVTKEVKSATAGLSGEAFSDKKRAVQARLETACVGKESNDIRCDLVELYKGGKYSIYKYARFQDVRLAWAPEEAIAFFGGDPDNFNFPRYDLDASILRVYKDGKPLAVKDYFPFSVNGAEENELVMTLGHPGSTNRQYTVSQLEYLRDFWRARGNLYLSEMRGRLNQFALQGKEQERISRDMLFGIENGYKSRIGGTQALFNREAMQHKAKQESELRAWVNADPQRKAKYGAAWDEIAKAQKTYEEMYWPLRQIGFGGAFGGSSYFAYAQPLLRAADERSKPNEKRLPEYAEQGLPALQQELLGEVPVHPELEKALLIFSLEKMREYLGPDHAEVKRILGNESPQQMAERLTASTVMGDAKARKALWDGGKKAVDASNDPFIKLARLIDPLARELRKKYENEVQSVEEKNHALISAAMFERYGDKIAPDATFTMRLSDGVVKGWTYNGATVPAFTDIDGAFDRHTGSYPFALPQTWLSKQKSLNGLQRFNVSTTNDIVGGNSGSPLINRKAELVGLVFDGNIHSLGGDYWYDERINRAVSVHSGAILEALEKIYGADELLNEIRAAREQ